ncbi:hypothetical protein ACQ86E_19540 [Bradyrhizobium betae]|uniref:hypothetical protein n=1 Tax=Bradyrhizobium betae TaxID=244734 RepID=UPI003D665E79
MELVAANPYVMTPLLSWKQMDELGRRLLREDGREPSSNARRWVGAADEAVKRMLRRGDTAASLADFTAELGALLGALADCDLALKAALGNGAALRAGDQLRAPGAAALEDDLVERLKTLSSRPLEPRLKAMAPSRWAEILADLAGPGGLSSPNRTPLRSRSCPALWRAWSAARGRARRSPAS